MEKITETIVLEVVAVERRTHYPKGYTGKAEVLTMIKLAHNTLGRDGLRSAEISIPGDLPLGTRFTLNIEQLDEVTSATIHRGALPNVIERQLTSGSSDDIQ